MFSSLVLNNKKNGVKNAKYSRLNNACCDNHFQAVVVLGSPRRECAGSGICMITTARAVKDNWLCPYLLCEISMPISNALRFRCWKQSANTPTIYRYFSRGYFEISDAYMLPLRVLTYMGLVRDTYIVPGVYPVIETDETWEFSIPFAMSNVSISNLI